MKLLLWLPTLLIIGCNAYEEGERYAYSNIVKSPYVITNISIRFNIPEGESTVLHIEYVDGGSTYRHIFTYNDCLIVGDTNWANLITSNAIYVAKHRKEAYK